MGLCGLKLLRPGRPAAGRVGDLLYGLLGGLAAPVPGLRVHKCRTWRHILILDVNIVHSAGRHDVRRGPGVGREAVGVFLRVTVAAQVHVEVRAVALLDRDKSRLPPPPAAVNGNVVQEAARFHHAG